MSKSTTVAQTGVVNAESVKMIQERLQSMNTSGASDVYQSLPADAMKRVNALKQIQIKHKELVLQFQREVLVLEKKYHTLYQPLYNKRSEIVTGLYEPTDEESALPEGDEVPETNVEAESQEQKTVGVPQFWVTVLKNHPQLSEMISEEDEKVLSSLVDIKISYLDDNPGFRLDFCFTSNEYFTNEVLSKTYFLSEPLNDSSNDDYMYDHAEGTEIQWKEGKNLAVKVEIKKQRHKGTNQTRVVKKNVPSETFFNFFNPPQIPGDDEEITEDDAAALDEKLESDYELGEDIKEKLVPNAINWFTGAAVELGMDEFDEFDDSYDYDDEDGDAEGEDDEDDDDDEDEDGAAGDNPPATGDKPPECKQQ